MSDGAKGMRALVASVAPTLSKPTLDWFHLAMKIHAVRTALGACAMTQSQRPAFMARSSRVGNKIRDLLWRGRTDEGSVAVTRCGGGLPNSATGQRAKL